MSYATGMVKDVSVSKKSQDWQKMLKCVKDITGLVKDVKVCQRCHRIGKRC